MNVLFEKIIIFLCFSGIWLIIHLFVPFLMIRIPSETFLRFEMFFRPFSFERNGLIYEKYFKIKKWKKYLPDGGTLMRGGFEKSSLKSRDKLYLKTFIIETYRAEATHMIILAHSVIFYVSGNKFLFLIMFLIMSIIHIPCILVQRYNRPRIERMLNVFEKLEEKQTFSLLSENKSIN